MGGATVTLIGTTNGKTFQGATAPNGQDTISGVDAGNYSYVVAAPNHDPASGSVIVTANATAQVNVLMTYDVVNLTFSVTPTTITGSIHGHAEHNLYDQSPQAGAEGGSS